MTYPIVQSALLCVGLFVSGCAVSAADNRGYAAVRYPSYGYQQRDYVYTQSRQYPVERNHRYAPRVQVVEIYRRPVYYSAPRRYEPPRYRLVEQDYRDNNYHYDTSGRGERYERDQRREHRNERNREQRRGWEIQRY